LLVNAPPLIVTFPLTRTSLTALHRSRHDGRRHQRRGMPQIPRGATALPYPNAATVLAAVAVVVAVTAALTTVRRASPEHAGREPAMAREPDRHVAVGVMRGISVVGQALSLRAVRRAAGKPPLAKAETALRLGFRYEHALRERKP
jgi:hypothetical protein